MNRLLALALVVSTLPAVPAAAARPGRDLEIQELSGNSQTVTSQRPSDPTAASVPQSSLPDWGTSVYPYYQTLKTFTFDNGALGDAQSWTTHDLTQQDGVFWHVDDFAGLPAPYAPLSGSKSMWCGVRPGQITDPAYAVAEGYGNRWTQILGSVVFPAFANQQAQISFLLSYDFWAGDRLDVEYKSAAGVWTLLATYEDDVDMSGGSHAHVVPPSQVGSQIEFRFVLSTSLFGSSEDGQVSSYSAVIIDNVRVTTLLVDRLDTFEGPVGQTSSTWWSGSIPAPFGNYAGLVSGASVVQDGTPNPSHAWSFFNGSSATYACGGHPAQPAVPYTANPGSMHLGDYIVNEVRSPFIDLSVDEDNQPVNPDFAAFAAEFDVYTDLAYPANTIMYSFRWRFMINGVVQPWISNGLAYYSFTPQWNHVGPRSFNATLPAGATHVQIGLIAFDFAYNDGITALCHSQSPLFDNVLVHRMYRPVAVTTTNDSGSGSLRQAILSANANPNMNTILFDIAGAGPHVIQPVTPLPVITAPVWIDGFTQSGATPNQWAFPASTAVLKVEIDGSLLAGTGNGLLFGSGGYGVVRGLAIGGFPEAGVRSETTSLLLNACYIGTDIWGTTANPNNVGIMITNPTADIGGPANTERTVVAGNTTDGIVISAGTGPIFNTYVGVAADGSPLGNGQDGIHVTNGTGAGIGQPVWGPCVTGYTDRNRIAYNGRDGIRVEDAASNVNIFDNRIYANGGMGIDLGGDGPTANDPLDADSGANGLQNHPVLIGADGTSVSGILDAAANTQYRVEFFASGACGTDGDNFIGYQQVTTNGSGYVPFAFTCGPIPPASTITATATPDVFPFSTSEFSPCVLSSNTPPGAPLVTLFDPSNIVRASVEYENVVSAGNTYLTQIAPPAPVPGGFDVGSTPTYWDITTTAVYDANTHVSLYYDPNSVPGPENMLRLLHHVGGAWVDVTDDVDIANHRIGGTTSGLSPFVLAVPTGATGVGDGAAPSDFALHGNVPNPFNPVTTIAYDVPAGGADVSIAIFDVSGRMVRTLVSQRRGAGRFTAQWNGEDDRGGRVASGVYFYRMRAGVFVETKKMVLLK